MKFLLYLVVSDRADVLVSVSEEQPGFYRVWCVVLGVPAQSAEAEGLWFEVNLFAAQVSDKRDQYCRLLEHHISQQSLQGSASYWEWSAPG